VADTHDGPHDTADQEAEAQADAVHQVARYRTAKRVHHEERAGDPAVLGGADMQVLHDRRGGNA